MDKLIMNKKTWVLIGIILWALPTGLIVSYFLTVISLDQELVIVDFQKKIFFRNLMIAMPIFITMGIMYGVKMYNKSQKISK